MLNRASVAGTKNLLPIVERGTTMWRRNKLYTNKGINMSVVIVVKLLTLLLVSQSSYGQVDPIPAEEVAECQVDQILEMDVVDDQVNRNPEVAIADGLPEPWISDLFYQALSNFKIQHVGSSACRAQSDMYDRHLRNHTSWAVRSE